ncbi:MAG TPA: Yip1 family protein [Rhabdochlamydiaceae bacterium]
MGTKLSINPWTQMWVRPRETIRAIIQTNPGYMYPLLCFIYGFPMALQLAQNFSLGNRFHVAGIVVGAAILAIIVGAVMINIATALFTWTGKWIGGVGTYQQVRAAVAWSNMPSVVNIAIWVINLAVFGVRIFRSDFVETQFVGNELSIIFMTALVQLVVAVWAFVITLKALGEVQGFSAWKALLNILIPIFVIFIGVSILAWLFTLMTGTPH